jgi:hypothetical protein
MGRKFKKSVRFSFVHNNLVDRTIESQQHLDARPRPPSSIRKRAQSASCGRRTRASSPASVSEAFPPRPPCGSDAKMGTQVASVLPPRPIKIKMGIARPKSASDVGTRMRVGLTQRERLTSTPKAIRNNHSEETFEAAVGAPEAATVEEELVQGLEGLAKAEGQQSDEAEAAIRPIPIPSSPMQRRKKPKHTRRKSANRGPSRWRSKPKPPQVVETTAVTRTRIPSHGACL